ncbi:MAG: hypothetical protein H7124_17140 [Phycisphaerales bacterium]|nr:hypothetical protein [Hyphomonadaceae bacterium]
MSENPTFDVGSAMWANTVMIQAIIVQLIETRVFSVAEAERVFDLAYARTKKERADAPDAEKVVRHVHDSLSWDDFYRWEAAQPKRDTGP